MPVPLESDEDTDPPSLLRRVWRMLVGAPRKLSDTAIAHRMSLVPFLAWVGLGADGLSSSAYGPEEAFRTLGEHTYLAVALAAVMAATILIISSAYSRIIEDFPHGGGGYVVPSKLLGKRVGVVSGSALVVDYVLTITISVAAAGDALFSFLPVTWHAWKLPFECVVIAGLMTLNMRGVRESIVTLTPIFIVFLITHAAVIVGGILGRGSALPATAVSVAHGFRDGLAAIGVFGLLQVFVHAYSLGGGTYTGIEAVSNGLQIMREPRVLTAKRTMQYMAFSLAFTAAGLLLCYLLWGVRPVQGQTLNAVLTRQIVGNLPFAHLIVVITLLSEGALLVVAAQAGFIAGPRVLANMAVDSYAPRRFAALSDRLTTQNGILMMGGASLLALWYTRGDVRHIVVMYSINVFLTFALSLLGMTVLWVRRRKERPHWKRRTLLFLVGFLLCATILSITIFEKFQHGGWVTLVVTSAVAALCLLIHRHYTHVSSAFSTLYVQMLNLPMIKPPEPIAALDPTKPTAALLVGTYGGVGIHTTLDIFKSFPGHFKNIVFVSAGVIDTGAFKGERAVEELRRDTEAMVKKYLELAAAVGVPATSEIGIGTDAVEEAEHLCLRVLKEFPRTTFFAGQVIFRRERWYHRFLHNQTAFTIQKRLQWAGQTMVILPVKIPA